jgi:H+/Cl- antiporter ClcA
MSRTRSESSLRSPSHTTTTEMNRTSDIDTTVPAAGSGVREVKLIIEGFWFEGYLTWKTFLIKSVAMILSTASGLSIGKEGPFIHLGTSVAAMISDIFGIKCDLGSQNFLSAGAASGLAVAFGAPISGVVFVLEDIRCAKFHIVSCLETNGLSVSHGAQSISCYYYLHASYVLALLIFTISPNLHIGRHSFVDNTRSIRQWKDCSI